MQPTNFLPLLLLTLTVAAVAGSDDVSVQPEKPATISETSASFTSSSGSPEQPPSSRPQTEAPQAATTTTTTPQPVRTSSESIITTTTSSQQRETAATADVTPTTRDQFQMIRPAAEPHKPQEPPKCSHNDKQYTVGQKWNDDCVSSCECVLVDDLAIAACRKRCQPHYDALGEGCILVRSKVDECCLEPVCRDVKTAPPSYQAEYDSAISTSTTAKTPVQSSIEKTTATTTAEALDISTTKAARPPPEIASTATTFASLDSSTTATKPELKSAASLVEFASVIEDPTTTSTKRPELPPADPPSEAQPDSIALTTTTTTTRTTPQPATSIRTTMAATTVTSPPPSSSHPPTTTKVAPAQSTMAEVPSVTTKTPTTTRQPASSMTTLIKARQPVTVTTSTTTTTTTSTTAAPGESFSVAPEDLEDADATQEDLCILAADNVYRLHTFWYSEPCKKKCYCAFRSDPRSPYDVSFQKTENWKPNSMATEIRCFLPEKCHKVSEKLVPTRDCPAPTMMYPTMDLDTCDCPEIFCGLPGLQPVTEEKPPRVIATTQPQPPRVEQQQTTSATAATTTTTTTATQPPPKSTSSTPTTTTTSAPPAQTTSPVAESPQPPSTSASPMAPTTRQANSQLPTMSIKSLKPSAASSLPPQTQQHPSTLVAGTVKPSTPAATPSNRTEKKSRQFPDYDEFPLPIIQVINAPLQRYTFHLLVALAIMTVLFVIMSCLYMRKSSFRTTMPITDGFDEHPFTKQILISLDESQDQNFKNKNKDADKYSPVIHMMNYQANGTRQNLI